MRNEQVLLTKYTGHSSISKLQVNTQATNSQVQPFQLQTTRAYVDIPLCQVLAQRSLRLYMKRSNAIFETEMFYNATGLASNPSRVRLAHVVASCPSAIIFCQAFVCPLLKC